MRHKVVTSEALGPGSVLVSREREKAWEKRNVFSLDLKPATVTTENIFLVVSSRQLVQSTEKRKSKNSVTWWL